MNSKERAAIPSAQRDRSHGGSQRALTGSEARQQLLAWMPVTERRVPLAGVLTPILEGGNGPPVILLHGPAAYAAHWIGVIPGLTASHRVIAPDLPGHGASVLTAEALDDEGAFAWLGALIDRTCTQAPVLVGQTAGAALAARFAVARSDRLARLILIDSLGLSEFRPTPQFALALNEYLAQPNERTHRDLWRQCAYDLDGLRDRMGERWAPFETYNLDRACTPSVMAAVSALMGQFGLPAIPAADLARISVPTDLMWGRHDTATPLAVAQAASERFGWPLHVIEHCADDPPVEQPAALLRVLQSVLGETRLSERRSMS